MLAYSTGLLLGAGALMMVVGTTSAASITLVLIKSLNGEEMLARRLTSWFNGRGAADYGGKWTYRFSSGIEPNWREGRILLRDVHVECGGSSGYSSNSSSPSSDIDGSSDYNDSMPSSNALAAMGFTQFSVDLDGLEVKISFKNWLKGRGWLEEVYVDGATGWIEPRHQWTEEVSLSAITADATTIESNAKKAWRFDVFKGVELRNAHVTWIQSGRRIKVSVLNARLPRLRSDWFFYDCLSADGAHGIFDGHALFSLHTPLKMESRELRHFRVVGLDVKHLALAWVSRGTVDIDGFLKLPLEVGDAALQRRSKFLEFDVFDSFIERILRRKDESKDMRASSDDSIVGALDVIKSFLLMTRPFEVLESLFSNQPSEANRGIRAEDTVDQFLNAPADSLSFQFDFVFRNLRAHHGALLPGGSASAGNGAAIDSPLLRAVIGYVNEHRPLIPLSCQFNLPQQNFHSSWTAYDSGLLPAIFLELEGALERLAWDPQRRLQRIGKIGRWTLGTMIKGFV